jgi:hypothetical protein
LVAVFVIKVVVAIKIVLSVVTVIIVEDFQTIERVMDMMMVLILYHQYLSLSV